MSAVFRLLHFLHGEVSEPYDALVERVLSSALVERVLSSIIVGDGAAAAGLRVPEEVANDSSSCRNHTYLAHEALRQTYLLIREGGLRLTSRDVIKGAAYISYQTLVLVHVVAASTRENPPSPLKWLPYHPLALALLDELNALTADVERTRWRL